MKCDCIEKVNDALGKTLALVQGDNSHDPNIKRAVAEAFQHLAQALAPPAEAARGEDWREKCEILHAPGGFYVEWWNDRGGWWIDHKSGQFLLCAAKPGHDWALFPTRAAAEAALASASPPGQPAASSGDDNGNPRDDSWRPPKPAPQPATAEFDAAEWADRVRYRIDNSPSVNRVEIIASEGGLLWLSAYAAGLSAREQPQLADATDAAFKAGYVEGQRATRDVPQPPAPKEVR